MHVVDFKDADGISHWKAEALDGKTKVKTFPNHQFPEKMEG
jgi:hypothetical protein